MNNERTRRIGAGHFLAESDARLAFALLASVRVPSFAFGERLSLVRTSLGLAGRRQRHRHLNDRTLHGRGHERRWGTLTAAGRLLGNNNPSSSLTSAASAGAWSD